MSGSPGWLCCVSHSRRLECASEVVRIEGEPQPISEIHLGTFLKSAISLIGSVGPELAHLSRVLCLIDTQANYISWHPLQVTVTTLHFGQ